nr:udp-glycosyltransferase 89b2 [Quercus suber]
MSRDPPKNNDPHKDINFLISLPKVPNSPTYPWWQIPPHYRNDLEADPDWEFHRNSMLANFESWGIVFNSFASLESVYFDHLKREVGHNRVWAVGPLLPLEGDLIGSATREQFTNALLLVDQLGVAIRAGEGTENISDSNELARLLVVSLNKIKPQNVRAKELSDVALSTVKGGSSAKDSNELIKQLADIKKLE